MDDNKQDRRGQHAKDQAREPGSTKFAPKPGAVPKPKPDARVLQARRAEKARSKAESRFWRLVESPDTPAEIVARSLAELRKMGAIPDLPGAGATTADASLLVAAGFARRVGWRSIVYSARDREPLVRTEGGEITNLISDEDLATRGIEGAADFVRILAKKLQGDAREAYLDQAISTFTEAILGRTKPGIETA